MDPGIALGGASIAFHVFSGCIKGCQLLAEAGNMPKEYEYLRHRLKLEELKLMDWWRSSRLMEEAASQDTQAQEKVQAMIDSLGQIQSLTLDINKIKQRYSLILEVVDDKKKIGMALPLPMLPSFQASFSFTFHEQLMCPWLTSLSCQTFPARGELKALRQKALKHTDVSWKAYPKQLRWAAFDAASFERLLLHFAGLNNSMLYFLEAEERRQHHRLQEATHMQVLEVHNKLGQITQLVQSLHLNTPRYHDGLSRDSQTSEPNKLEQLARFKALSVAVTQEDQSHQGSAAEEIGMPAPVATCLEITRLQLTSINGQTHSKPQRAAGTYNSDTVWVEWKYYDVQTTTTLAYPYIEHRIARLSILLKSPGKPDEFRLPSCIGYVHDPSSTRIGLVFASLIPESPSNP
jgi:Prion-inhibition and propagation